MAKPLTEEEKSFNELVSAFISASQSESQILHFIKNKNKGVNSKDRNERARAMWLDKMNKQKENKK